MAYVFDARGNVGKEYYYVLDDRDGEYRLEKQVTVCPICSALVVEIDVHNANLHEKGEANIT